MVLTWRNSSPSDVRPALALARVPVLVLALALALVAACAQDELDADSDGDGLSDRQELAIGTDPHDPDSNGNGVPDGADPNPLPDRDPRLTLSADPVQDADGARTAAIEARLRDGRGGPIAGAAADLGATTELGRLTPFEERAEGVYAATLRTRASGLTDVRVTYTDGAGRTATDSVQIAFPAEEPPPPGVNTGEHVDAGPLAGELTVFTVDARSTEWSGQERLPFPGAFVQVRLPDGTALEKRSSDQGVADFLDDRLGADGPVTVTVGAAGTSYRTFYDLDAAVLSVPLKRLDPIEGADDADTGSVEGIVRGFRNETGLVERGVAFDPDDDFSKIFDGRVNAAIVQVGLRNVPLSSISAGTILEPPAPGWLWPSNMVLYNKSAPQTETYRLTGLWPGRYLVFALGGVVTRAGDAVANPYKIRFEPRALAIAEVEVRAGQTTTADLALNIPLSSRPAVTVDLGALPDDPLTGEPLRTALMLPVMDTGKGFVFVDVDGTYNHPGFANPVEIRFPDPRDPELLRLGLQLDPLLTGLAGRDAVFGADPPGISTTIRHVWPPAHLDYDVPSAWLPLPVRGAPAPPVGPDLPLDAVGGVLEGGRLAWDVWGGADAAPPDLFVLRLNYMTPAPPNPLPQPPGSPPLNFGGPRSHMLWELFVPGHRREVVLPELPADAPGMPILRNPDPTSADDPGRPKQTYAEDVLELEINVYDLGGNGKPFDYGADFELTDVNLHADGVSQDSYLFRVPSE
jgi:hypothetical protein